MDIHLAISALDSVDELIEAVLAVHVEEFLKGRTSAIKSFAGLEALANALVHGPISFLTLGVAVIRLSYGDVVVNARSVFASNANLGR
jgi:hypothetical protein